MTNLCDLEIHMFGNRFTSIGILKLLECFKGMEGLGKLFLSFMEHCNEYFFGLKHFFRSMKHRYGEIEKVFNELKIETKRLL